MEEAIKNKVILILSILCLIFALGLIGSCSNSFRQRNLRNKEMITRLDLEEKMSKHLQEKAVLDKKISSLSQELEEEKDAHQAIKKALVQEQLVSQSLKDELNKVTKLKETLEENLKEALVSGKSDKSKRMR